MRKEHAREFAMRLDIFFTQDTSFVCLSEIEAGAQFFIFLNKPQPPLDIYAMQALGRVASRYTPTPPLLRQRSITRAKCSNVLNSTDLFERRVETSVNM